MNPTNKTLLTALVLSLFSLATVQGIQVINRQNSSSKVLGDTTMQGIPCTVINTWQQQYCQSIGVPTPPPKYPIPTTINIPTSTECKTGVSSIIMINPCSNSTGFYYAKYLCYDNYAGYIGDLSYTKCSSSKDLEAKALEACKGRTSCQTVIPTATPTKSLKVLNPVIY